MTLTKNDALELAKGDCGPLTVTVSFSALGASGLANYHAAGGEIWFIGKWDESDTTAIFTKTLEDGVTVTQDGNNTNQNGIISVVLAIADTADFPDFPFVAKWAIKVRDGVTPTNEFTLTYGDLLVVATSTSKVS